MQKLFKSLIMLVIVAVVSVSSVAIIFANDDIRLVVDGQMMSFHGSTPPIIVDGRVLVPFRDDFGGIFEDLNFDWDGTSTIPAVRIYRNIFEYLGFDTYFDADINTALISNSYTGFHIAIDIDAPYFSVAVFSPDMPVGHAVIMPLDVSAQVIGRAVLVPLRPILESIGYSLDWDEEMRTVLITSAS